MELVTRRKPEGYKQMHVTIGLTTSTMTLLLHLFLAAKSID
jgi:hypothetical protein